MRAREVLALVVGEGERGLGGTLNGGEKVRMDDSGWSDQGQLHPLRQWLTVNCEVWGTQAAMLGDQVRRLRTSQREFLRLEARFDRVARAAECRGGLRKPSPSFGGFLGAAVARLVPRWAQNPAKRPAKVSPTLESAARRVARRARENAKRARAAADQVAEDAERAGAEAASAREHERTARKELRTVKRVMLQPIPDEQDALRDDDSDEDQGDDIVIGGSESGGEGSMGAINGPAGGARRGCGRHPRRKAAWVSTGLAIGWLAASGLAGIVQGVAGTPHDDVVELTEVMSSLNSVTGNESKIHEVVEAWMEGRDWDYGTQKVDKKRGNLFGIPGRVDYPPKLLFSTHSDTVPPHLGAAERTMQYVKGRGSTDAHGVLSAMLHAADDLAEDEGCSVGVLVVVGEEVDHVGAITSQNLWRERTPLGPSLGEAKVDLVVGEPTEGKLATVQKGMLKLKVTADGVAAHSGYPELGSSAISSLMAFLTILEKEKWPSDRKAGQTTLNVGLISGGVAANVIAPKAEAEVFIRVATTARAIEDKVRQLAAKFPSKVRIERLGANDPFEFFAFDAKDKTFEREAVSYNTDAPYMTAHHAQGGRTLLAGPGSIHNAHTPNEQISIDDLHAGVALYKRIARAMPGVCPPRNEL